MIKRKSRDYTHNKPDLSLSDATTNSSISGDEYVAFDMDGQVQHPIIGQVSTKADFKWLFVSCIEEAFSFFLEWFPLTIILSYLSQYASEEIQTGFGLGLVWLNCVGQGLYYGLASGLETMAAHAHGAGDFHQVGVLFHKTLFVSALMFFPISISMVFAENILGLWNPDPILCQIAGRFCMYSIPAIACLAVFYAYKAILNAQNEFRVQVYSSGINVILTVFFGGIFIKYLKLEIVGAAIVFSLSELTKITLCYLFAKRHINLSKCYVPFDIRVCVKDLRQFLSTAIPIGSLVCLEWILQETNSIIASNLPKQQYTANIITSNLTSTLVQFPLGYATAACTFIGNEMGRKNVKAAKQYAFYSACIVLTHLLITVLPLSIFKEEISVIFGVSPQVQQEISSLFGLALIVFCLDSTQSLVTAFMRAIGKERFSSASFMFSYALVGLNSSYFLAYHTDLQINGIWIGIMISMSLYILLQIVMLSCTDLEKMAEIISLRMHQREEIKQLLAPNTTAQLIL